MDKFEESGYLISLFLNLSHNGHSNMNRLILLLILCLSCNYALADVNPGIFKEYDIRGVVEEEFSIEDTADITAAIATYLREKEPTIQAIAIGADGRTHSPAIKQRMVDTFKKYGFTIIDIGTCTTPVMYFSLHTLPVEAGIMITASHNPGKYNGFKVCLGTTSVTGNEIQRIRAIYENRSFIEPSKASGRIQSYDLIGDYIDYLAESFPHLIGAGICPLVDCGNGAAGTVLPRLFEKMN